MKRRRGRAGMVGVASGLAAAMTAVGPVRADAVVASFQRVGDDVVPRLFHRAGPLANGMVVVSGGMTITIIPPSLVSLDTIAFFDPGAGTFSTSIVPSGGGGPVTPVLAVPRSSHTQTRLDDGRVLFTGGRTGASGSNPGTPIASVEIFDPATGLVVPGPDMSEARAGHTATRLPDGRVLVAGDGTWQCFDPETDTFTAPLALARTRADHAAVSLGDGRVLLIAGAGTGADTLEIVDPGAPATMLLASTLAVGVDDVAAARLDDGRVLICGGQDLTDGDTIADTYLLEPDADLLTVVPPVPNAPNGVADHVLVVRGRRAILAGGETQISGNDTERDGVAIFDRVAEDWIATATMMQAHDDFAAVPLGDDAVLLVSGGIGIGGQEFPSPGVEILTIDPTWPADIDGDGAVGFGDVLLVLSAWGPCEVGCAADLDRDGVVGFGDLLAVLSAWGPC